MSKYQDEYGASSVTLDKLLVNNEEVIWSGKPKRFAFIFNKAMTLLPMALLWLAFDSFFIIIMTKSGAFSALSSPMFIVFIVAFFVIHLFPVWMWVANILTAGKRWQNTEYAVTDRRMIIITGFVNMNVDSVFYTDITNVSLKYSLFDKILGVGDIYFDMINGSRCFLDLSDAEEIYTRVQKIVMDIQTDIHYPNNLRPDVNNGYNTSYRPDND
jgi:hypothetical protein